MKTKPSIARHDPAHCLCPGLFSSVKKGQRERLVIKYQHGKNTIEFKCFDQLGADDLRVLQGLISLAGRNEQTVITPTPKTASGLALREAMEMKDDASKQNAIVVKCGYKELFNEIGLSGGGAQIKALNKCLDRLFAVSIFSEGDGKRAGYHLLSSYSSSEYSLHVALNPAIATAVAGGRYVKIDMAEVRAIKTDPTRLIHQRLSGFIDPGKAINISIEALTGYVWGEGAANGNLAQYRRKILVRSLTELKSLNWHIMENAGIFRVQRP